MTWYIEDHNEYQIYITNLWTEWYVPKFRIEMVVDEPYLYLYYHNREAGQGLSEVRLQIDYRDIVDGYAGYLSDISSAQQLFNSIDQMITSGFTGGDDILASKGDLLTHDGVSDTILPVGTDGYVLVCDSAEATGLKWVDPSTL